MGRATDPTMGACTRKIWLILALGSFTITVCHKPGADIIFADIPQAALANIVPAMILPVRVSHDNKLLSPSL